MSSYTSSKYRGSAGCTTPSKSLHRRHGSLNSPFRNLKLRDDNRSRGSGSRHSASSRTKKSSALYQGPFVTASSEDDVFDDDANRTHRGSASSDRSKKQAMSGNWRRTSGNSDTSGSARSSIPASSTASEPVHEVTNADGPQTLYPPACCVFVGNLPTTWANGDIEEQLTQKFSHFGYCKVNVKRSPPNNVPVAFVQYREEEHALKACREGRNIVIGHRECRCEMAKAHRGYLVELHSGAWLSPNEVRRLLASFELTEFENIRSVNSEERLEYNVQHGVIVFFTYYENGITAFNRLRHDPNYTIRALSPRSSGRPTARDYNLTQQQRNFLSSWEIDGRSIHVSNIPFVITVDDLEEIFDECGAIREINIKEYVSQFNSQERRKFAFIEFKNGAGAEIAVKRKHGSFYRGLYINVTYKKPEYMINRSQIARGFTTPRRPQRDLSVSSPRRPSPIAPVAVQAQGSQSFGQSYGSTMHTQHAQPTAHTVSGMAQTTAPVPQLGFAAPGVMPMMTPPATPANMILVPGLGCMEYNAYMTLCLQNQWAQHYAALNASPIAYPGYYQQYAYSTSPVYQYQAASMYGTQVPVVADQAVHAHPQTETGNTDDAGSATSDISVHLTGSVEANTESV